MEMARAPQQRTFSPAQRRSLTSQDQPRGEGAERSRSMASRAQAAIETERLYRYIVAGHANR